MSQADLVITGGQVVSEHGVHPASIAVEDGRIVAVGERDAMPSAKRVIDVEGRHVFPGIIDPHIHLQTFANKFDVNIRTETKTAAVGGVTTIVPTLLNREDNQIVRGQVVMEDGMIVSPEGYGHYIPRYPRARPAGPRS
jgi:dihydroorotase-like cyclic amidohydrolase